MDLDLAAAAHARASARFSALVAALSAEPGPVPGLDWSTVEVGAHVLSLFRGYRRMAIDGVPLWPTTDGVDGNQRLLDETPERDPHELALALPPAGEAMRSALAAASGPLAAFGDVVASPAAILALNMADTLLHGFDLARALGRSWPIDRSDAALGLEGLFEILPAFVRPGSDLGASYGLSLRGDKAWGVRFDRGILTIDAGRPTRVDCRISADPVAWMLTSYGRASPVRAALTGKVITYGRKPWLAARIPDQFDPP